MSELETKINKEYQKILESLDKELTDYKSKNNITKPIYIHYTTFVKDGETYPTMAKDTPDIISLLFGTAYQLATASILLGQKE